MMWQNEGDTLRLLKIPFGAKDVLAQVVQSRLECKRVAPVGTVKMQDLG